jgi:pimeloyl-ACP methyl ester carboxylesterase
MVTFMTIVSVFILIVITLVVYRRYLQNQMIKNSRRLTANGGISSVEEIHLGGFKQQILIQGEDNKKPILLVLHGGPSMPMPGVSCRGVDWVFNLSISELRKNFIVVFWDQRGTGKSYHQKIPKSSMNIEQFISDANELIDWLRLKYRQDKIYLSGASWGSIIGLHLANRYPEKFHAYFGIAQIVNWAKSDEIAYDWLLKKAKKAKNQKAISELTEIGRPPYAKELAHWNLLRKWLFKLGGYIYEDHQIRHPGMGSLFKTMLKSPDYRLIDIWNTFFNGMKLSYTPQMMNDFRNYDAFSQIKKLDMPCYFFHGKHDRAISGSLLEEYFLQLEASKGKRLHWLEHSAHIFCPSDADYVEKLMINFIKD